MPGESPQNCTEAIRKYMVQTDGNRVLQGQLAPVEGTVMKTGEGMERLMKAKKEGNSCGVTFFSTLCRDWIIQLQPRI